jgi:uncharacterized protein (DUF924 family)
MTTELAWYFDALSERNEQIGDDRLPPELAEPSANARLRQALSSADDDAAVVDFWRKAGPGLWFAKDDGFDRTFREKFLSPYEAAACGQLLEWTVSPGGTLALLLLLDQFPRNAFRGTPRMYATDDLALGVARAAVDARHDLQVQPELQLFFYLPFAHSEEMAHQDLSVALARRLGETALSHAEGHRSIIRRFGRFPHRNPILGRAMTLEEQRFLDEGGFAG